MARPVLSPSPPAGGDAVVEVRWADYERWRVSNPAGAGALVERWPGQPDRAAAAHTAAAWLEGRAPTAAVLRRQGDALWSALPPGTPVGSPLYRHYGASAVGVLGRALRELHALPPDDFPVRQTLDELVEVAGVRVAAGAVEPADLRAPYVRYGPERLLALARASLGRATVGEVPVVTHGACSADHLYVQDGRATAWLRLDVMAVADRHLDLARLAKEVAERLGPESVPALFDAYGMPPDMARLDALALLDELLP